MTEFSPQQKAALAHVLDEIIPPSADGRLPGAGQAGLADYIETVFRPTPVFVEMIAQGLDALDALATRRFGRGFASLERAESQTVLNDLASTEDGFPPLLMLQTYSGYYQHEHVLAALGLEARAPHPHGYEMGDDDLSLLDPVRRGGPRYREV